MQKISLKTNNEKYAAFIKTLSFLVANIILILSGWFLKIESAKTRVILSLLFSLFFILFFECLSVCREETKKMRSWDRIRFFMSALLTMFCCEMIRVTLAEPQSLEYLDILKKYFFSVVTLWYFIPLPALYCIQFSFSEYTGKQNIRVAIIGLTDNGLATEKALINEYSNVHLDLAFYDERALSRCDDIVDKVKSPFRGPVINLVEEARQGNIDEIYIALPMVALHRIRHVLAMISDTTVDTYIVPDFYAYSNNMSRLRTIHNLQTIGIFSSPFEGAGSFIKRAEDLVLGSIIMVMISWLMLAIAIGIKLTSRGPVFFKQDRYGLSGQKIKVWKFRSMRVMENADTVIQATKNDPRVTKFGSFLRRTSLDELPQFINVLQGSMSIVGPRPHAVTHNEQYRKQVENYMIRHKVKPGITGLAQINGFRGEIDALYKMEKRVQYDIEYIQNWSLWLDIKIIIKTI
ncbi:undecaprenyl-phosphate glucose phosphotransferase, partial [Citrobacter braakii]|nr:undecaprenyl-phosphate glucose phosphotransferase [Citrobacter braakii]